MFSCVMEEDGTKFSLWCSYAWPLRTLGFCFTQDWAVLPNFQAYSVSCWIPFSRLSCTGHKVSMATIPHAVSRPEPSIIPWRVRSKGLCAPNTMIWAATVHAALYTWHCACGTTHITQATGHEHWEWGEESYRQVQMVRTVGIPKAQPYEQQFW